MHRLHLAVILMLFTVSSLVWWSSSSADDPHAAKPDLSTIMQKKQQHAQQVLEGLINEDYERILLAADGLLAKGVQESMQQFKSDGDDQTYEHFRLEFLLHSSQLIACSKQKNLPGATLYFQNLVQTCIECHQHLRLDEPATVDSRRR